jgi:hypothetical protein
MQGMHRTPYPKIIWILFLFPCTVKERNNIGSCELFQIMILTDYDVVSTFTCYSVLSFQLCPFIFPCVYEGLILPVVP